MASLEEQKAKKFYELRRDGATTEEIASQYFLSPTRVSHIIKSYEREHQLPSSAPRMRKAAAQKREIHTKSTVPKSTHPRVREKAEQRGKEFRELRLKGATLDDIASMHGLTRQRVDQIIKRYERRCNLPSSTPLCKELVQKAKQADLEEYREVQRREKQLHYKRFVPSFQLDAHLVGRFLQELGRKAVLYGFDGKAKSNPRARKDGTPFPSSSTPTNIFMSGNASTSRRHITVHSWVLQRYGIKLEEGQHCHHVDGDVTNNMIENLQVLSSEEHGRLTIQEQRQKGILNYRHRSSLLRSLTIEQVEEIRALYRPKVTPIRKIAKAYGVGHSTIEAALYGLRAYSDINPSTRHVRGKSKAEQISLDFGSQSQ